MNRRAGVDAVGTYMEVVGQVLSVTIDDENDDWDDVEVSVRTLEYGDHSGWIAKKHAPKAGYMAAVRVYDAGGGHYPENRIVWWSVS